MEVRVHMSGSAAMPWQFESIHDAGKRGAACPLDGCPCDFDASAASCQDRKPLEAQKNTESHMGKIVVFWTDLNLW